MDWRYSPYNPRPIPSEPAQLPQAVHQEFQEIRRVFSDVGSLLEQLVGSGGGGDGDDGSDGKITQIVKAETAEALAEAKWELYASIEEIDGKLTSIAGRLIEITNEVAGKASIYMRDQLHSEIIATRDSIQSIAFSLTEIRNEVASRASIMAVDGIYTEINDSEKGLTALAERLTEIEMKVQDFNIYMYHGLQARVSSNEDGLASTAGLVTDIQQQIGDFDLSSYNALYNAFYDSEDGLQATSARVTDLEIQVGDFSVSAYNALTVQVDNNENNLSALSAQVTDLNTGGPSSGNMYPNASYQDDLDGNYFSNAGQTIQVQVADPSVHPAWVLANGDQNTLHIKGFGLIPVDGVIQSQSERIPVEQARHYQASAYVNIHRCSAEILIVFYDASGNNIGSSRPATGNSKMDAPERIGAGVTLDSFVRIWCFGQSPAGTAHARVVIEMRRASSGTYTDPSVFLVRPYFGTAKPLQEWPSDWSDSSSADSYARVREEKAARETETSQLSTDITNLDSRLVNAEGDIVATAQATESLKTWTGYTTDYGAVSLAQKVTNLESDVDGNSASITEEANTRAQQDGLVFAEKTLKVEANSLGNYAVAGFGSAVVGGASGPAHSEFDIFSDRFAVRDWTTSSAQAPFVVSGGVTYIKNAVIENYSLGTIKHSSVATISKAYVQSVSKTLSNRGENYTDWKSLFNMNIGCSSSDGVPASKLVWSGGITVPVVRYTAGIGASATLGLEFFIGGSLAFWREIDIPLLDSKMHHYIGVNGAINGSYGGVQNFQMRVTLYGEEAKYGGLIHGNVGVLIMRN